MKNRRPSSRSTAFSLVELLVTMAIIGVLAVLAATVLPSLTQRAERADALAKTRTMGQAVLSYVPDHAGKLPPLFPGQVLEYEAGRGGRIVTECADYLGINQAEEKHLVSRAVVADGEVIDVFTAAGIKKPDISILSDDFLNEVRGIKQKNVAAELLAKLLQGQITTRAARNVVQARQFSEMLKKTLNAYHNRAIQTQEVIEELINLAREIDAAAKRGEELKMSDEELAFYDALAANESAVRAMGNKELKVIAAELVSKVRESVTIDWTMRESARSKIRVLVRRILRKYGYPPDLQDEAVQTVLLQAETLCKDWVA